MIAKMTPIETLLDWLGKNHYYIGNDLLEKVEELKQMEKQQHEGTWYTAHQAGRFEGKSIAEENWQTFESYYNETFKSK